MRFVDSFTGAAVTLASTYLSFMDVDQGSDAGVQIKEAVTASGFESYVLADDTRLSVSRVADRPSPPTGHPPTTFASGGGSVMDPTDPMELDQLCARLITLLADLEATRGLVKLEAREAHLQTASTHIGSHGDGHGGGDREGVQGHAHGECA